MPSLRSIMRLSTDHLSRQSKTWLTRRFLANIDNEFTGGPTRNGWFIAVPTETDPSLPEDLRSCLGYAVTFGAEFVEFHPDEPVDHELALFDENVTFTEGDMPLRWLAAHDSTGQYVALALDHSQSNNSGKAGYTQATPIELTFRLESNLVHRPLWLADFDRARRHILQVLGDQSKPV